MTGRSTERIRLLQVDNPTVEERLVARLEAMDPRFTIETATGGAEALERLQARGFDAVVAEHDLGDMTGVELLERVAETGDAPPFVLFTDSGSEAVASEAISAGVSDYVRKNADGDTVERLAAALDDAVGRVSRSEWDGNTDERLRELIEVDDDVLWMTSADWSELLFVNAAYERVWGRSVEALAEDPTEFLDGVHPADRDRVRAAMERLSNGSSVDIEFRLEASGDERQWVWVQGEPILGDDGNVSRIAGFTRDVTERKERELAYEEEQRFVDEALDTLDDIFYVLDTDGELRRWNNTVGEVLGYDNEELDGLHALEFFPPDEHEAIGDAIEAVLETGRSTVEADIRCANGVRVPYEFVGGRLTDPAGEVTGLVGIGRDLTERNRRKRELDLYETIVETMPELLFIVDEDEEVEMVNDVASAFLGVEPAWMTGKTLDELLDDGVLPRSVVDQYRERVEAMCTGGARQTVTQYEQSVWDGSERRTVEIHLAVRQGDEGFQGTVGLVRDVTEERRQERELRRQNDRLEEFASVVSHDLRNPLNIAEGKLELGREAADNEHFADVARAHKRMAALIDDLLTLARQGKTIDGLETVNLRRVVERCWDTVDEDDVSLEVEIDRRIKADEARLVQLLENLFRNAVEHGGEAVSVGALADDPGFFVADDGPGIPADQRERIFEAGYTNSASGTGLGLSIVRRIAQAHGWQIEVEESEAGGARIEIRGVERDR